MQFLKKALLISLASVMMVSLAACGGQTPRSPETEALSTSATPPESTPQTDPATAPLDTTPVETEPAETEPAETQPMAAPLTSVYQDPHYTLTEDGATAERTTDRPFGGAILDHETLQGDFSVELHIKPASLKADVGILFCAAPTEAENGFEGYAFTICGNTVFLYRVGHSVESGITVTELAHRVVNLDKRVLMREGCFLRVARTGNTFRCYFCDDAEGVEPWPEFEYVVEDTDASGVGYFDNGRGASFDSLTLSAVEPAVSPAATYQNPVFGASGADPGVLYHNGTYYLYSTNYVSGAKGYPVYTSPDLVNWEFAGMCTGELWSTKYYWAPEVVEKDGRFYMIATNNVCLGIAVADSPLGPFEPVGDLLLNQAIDGNFFFDDDGKAYLYYVNVMEGEPYGIFGCELTEDLTSIKPGTTTLLLQYTDPWEATTVEAPEMIKHNGVYYLTYSGNTYTSEKYAIGYATSDSPLGEFHRYSANPILNYTSEIQGTGHHCFTTSPDGSELWIVYHVHSAIGVYEPRTLCIDRVRFAPTASGIDRLEAYGPTHTPQPYPKS